MADYGSTPPPPPPPPNGQQPGAAGPTGQAPPNYLVLAILAILCCLPFGIASIIFSTQVNSKWTMGDQAGAMEASRKAKLFAMISLGIGVVWAIIWAIAAATGGLSFSFNAG